MGVAVAAVASLAGCASVPTPAGVPLSAPPRGAAPGDPAALDGWTLVWSDEFDGPAGSPPDPAVWSSDVGNRDTNGWGNRELQDYTAPPRNAALDGRGHLVLRADRSSDAGPCWNAPRCDYTSARLLTRGKLAFTHGRVEARIRVPAGAGLWPAFWALGDGEDWPAAGELDVMELIGTRPREVFGTAHGPGYSGAGGIGKIQRSPVPYADDFHVFTLIKRPQEIVWQVDGIAYHRLTPASLPAGTRWVFERPFFLLLNLAVGGNLPGPPDARTPFPAAMTVDWVRLYRAR